MLEDGRLHLSGIATLAPLLKTPNLADGEKLLARAIHRSKRDIKILVAELAPKPGRCTFRTKDGRRCPESHQLEFHHDEAYSSEAIEAPAISGSCRAHNLYMAELDYGNETMDLFRRSAESVREPAPSFKLRPGRPMLD
jgi:hypothetical protein